MLGRPVFFVDDDPERDAQAQAALRSAARAAPAFARSSSSTSRSPPRSTTSKASTREEKVLVADIGGGTSDFSLVRVGPERDARRLDRKGDILANHGVHIAGTDFDRRVELASILPLFGYGAFGPSVDGAPAREVPSGVYFDLATWHLINTVYNPQRVAELRGMRSFYADPAQHRAPDDGRRASASATSCVGPRREREDRRRRRRHDDDRPRPRRARPGGRARRGRRAATRSTPTSIASSPRRATTVRAGRARARTRSTRSTSPAARPACDCCASGCSAPSRRRGRCAATASPASRPAWRCTRSAASPAGGAADPAPRRRSAQPASTAAIASAVASTLPRVQAGDAHPARAHQVDRELLAQPVDLRAASGRCS